MTEEREDEVEGNTPRERTRQDKRERILAAAVKVFAERGFYNAKVSQVASEAGVADGTIYLYFKNKDDLLIETFEDRMNWINERLREGIQDERSPLENLRHFVRMHLMLAIHARDLAEFITVELRQSSKFLKEYKNTKFAEYLNILVGLITRGQESGLFRGDLDARLAARAIFGMLDEVMLTLVLARKQPTEEQIVQHAEQVERLVLGGLLAPAGNAGS